MLEATDFYDDYAHRPGAPDHYDYEDGGYRRGVGLSDDDLEDM